MLTDGRTYGRTYGRTNERKTGSLHRAMPEAGATKISYSDTVESIVPMIYESEIGRGHLPERSSNSSAG